MQFTFPEAKFGVSCLDYLAFFDLNPASGKVLQAQLRKPYKKQSPAQNSSQAGQDFLDLL